MPNYKHIFNYRKNSKGGGVSIFVHNSIKHEITEDISENGNHYLWIYIEKLSLNIGAIYKPGETNINSFLELYTSQLERRRRSIVFGDFNIDLLNKNSNVAKYRNEINETGYEILNKINKQYNTRETSTTNTILDHVCTNVKNHSFDVSIIESCLSDHKQIFLEVGSLATQSITKIRYKAIDYKKLYNSATIATYCNEENHYDYLERFISDLVNKNKINKIKIQNLPREDWINRRILNEIDQRNHMWQQTKSDPKDEKLRKNFIEQKDKVIKLIKTQKQKYYNDLFQDSYSKPKKMWEVINSLALNKTKDSSALPKLKSGSELVTEGNLVCNLFNTFFSSIGSDLANNIPNKYHMETGNILMHDHDHTHTTTLSEFTPCTIHEISKLIDDLDNNTSTGLDGISTKTIKCIKDIIVQKLTDCINMCLYCGVFPDSLKVAKVSPIFKSGSRTDPSNYRPVSVLPVISKIFERVLYNRLNEYLTEKKFLIDQQYGFRSKSSTLTAAADLITKIKTHIDQKSLALGIFIDLKKAFDTVSHHKLLQKLNNIGVTDKALKMLSSYLEKRKQAVKIGNYTSSVKHVPFGCPQGSILSPLLFLIYINNINQIGLSGHLTLYADDTCIFYFDKSIHNIISKAQKDLDLLSEWLKYNLLTINTTKTSFMIFAAKNKPIPEHLPLTINNDVIKRSNYEKYLGLWVDDKLTWKNHIDHVKTKVASVLGAIHKAAGCIPKKIRYIIYNSLVKSHLEYLIEIWGSAAKTNLNPLQRTQNMLIKTLFHYKYSTPTKTLYEKSKLLNLTQLYTYSTCVLIKNITSHAIQSNIQLHRKKITHNLRNKYKLELKTARTNYGKKTLLFEGAQLFNRLPDDIKNCDNIKAFKIKLKEHVQTL